MVKVAVVIVNYQSAALTCRCIASLRQQIKSFELSFVVVDNSPESEIEAISSKQAAVKIIRPAENLGFAGGCNMGIRYAQKHKADFIQLLNPDTIAEQDFIAKLVEAFSENPNAVLAGPKILKYQTDREVWYGGGRMNWWMGGPVQIFDHGLDGDGSARKVPFLSGCAMMIRSKALDRLGPLDEDYFLYYEDSDFVQRCLNKGYDVLYVPKAEVLHEASNTVGFQSDDYIYYFSRNRIRFMKRWARRHHFLFYMLFNTLVKIPGAVLIFGILKKRPRAAAAYLQGYWDGLWHNHIKARRQSGA